MNQIDSRMNMDQRYLKMLASNFYRIFQHLMMFKHLSDSTFFGPPVVPCWIHPFSWSLFFDRYHEDSAGEVQVVWRGSQDGTRFGEKAGGRL